MNFSSQINSYSYQIEFSSQSHFYKTQNTLIPKTPTKKERDHWKPEENYRYCKFIQANKALLLHKSKQQKDGIYNKMADAVMTRTRDNCKSHHQKMMRKYKTIDVAVNGLMSKKCSKFKLNNEHDLQRESKENNDNKSNKSSQVCLPPIQQFKIPELTQQNCSLSYMDEYGSQYRNFYDQDDFFRQAICSEQNDISSFICI